jgi:hypothetical protein
LFLRQRQHTGHGRERGSGGELKVFWFFSSEKNILTSASAPPRAEPAASGRNKAAWHPPFTQLCTIEYYPGQVPDVRKQRQETKVFCFFSSEKKKESSFSEEKEAKRLYLSGARVRRYGTWPRIGAFAIVPSNNLPAAIPFWERLGFARTGAWRVPEENNPFGVFIRTPEVDTIAARVGDLIIRPGGILRHREWGLYEVGICGPDGLLIRIGWPSCLIGQS